MEALSLRPHLVCLNVQQDMLEGRERDDAMSALLWRMGSCLQWARKHNVPVAHAHTIASYVTAPPIQGFEALPSEIIIAKRSLSIFAAEDWCRSMAADCDRILLMGLSRHCDVAASALDGLARGLQVVLLRNAIGLEPTAASESGADALCTLLAPAIASITTADLSERRGLRISN